MSDQPASRPGGRSGMSVSGTLSIIVAAVAVILGFLILRDINDDGEASSGGNGGGAASSTTSTLPGGSNAPDSTGAPATSAAPTLKPYTVLVANAAKVSGAAKSMTTALQGRGATVLEGTNSTLTDAQATTTIYYIAGYDLEAADLARVMGVTAPPQAMPATPPVADLSTAQVLVQLGKDKAGQPLPADTGNVGGAAAVTIAPTDTTVTPTT